MFMKLKTLVKGVVLYHITKIDSDQIWIANFIAIFQKIGVPLRFCLLFLYYVVSNQYAWRRSALSECFSSYYTRIIQ